MCTERVESTCEDSPSALKCNILRVCEGDGSIFILFQKVEQDQYRVTCTLLPLHSPPLTFTAFNIYNKVLWIWTFFDRILLKLFMTTGSGSNDIIFQSLTNSVNAGQQGIRYSPLSPDSITPVSNHVQYCRHPTGFVLDVFRIRNTDCTNCINTTYEASNLQIFLRGFLSGMQLWQNLEAIYIDIGIVGHMSAKSAKFFIQRKTANLFLGHLADLATSANSRLVLSISVFQKF